MAHHWIRFWADVLFWAALHCGPVPPARTSLEMLETELRPVSYEALLTNLTVANWKETK